MSVSPELLAAFEKWRLAELAGHFAQPCPDDVMDALVNHAVEAEMELGAVAPRSAEDLALQLFPLLLAIHEPKMGHAHLVPNFSDSRIGGKYTEVLWNNLLARLPGFASMMSALRDIELNEYCTRKAAS